MCTPECIIAMLGCPAFNEAVKAVIKAGKYARQYRTHMDNLRRELRPLEHAREIIDGRVRDAGDRGEEILNGVTQWQAEAGVMENDFQQLSGQVEARMHCFLCSCPNIKWRYRLGKQAEEKIRDVHRLIEEYSHFEQISHPKPPPRELEFPSAENYVHLDSRTPIFEQIVVALKDPNVKMIGVHGLGGVGKTTLVEKVAKKMLDDGTFKQIPLAAVSRVLNVKEIQKKLAGNLNLRLVAPTDEKENQRQLWDKFKNGGNYLVILDDIWEVVNLIAIGIPITDGKIGCKVVLTSRNKDLLEIRMKTDRNFPIAELKEGEAWDLFKKQVGNSMESQPGMESLAREVCKKCKGLPVAIKALGAALEGKPDYVWKSALDMLERYMLTDIEGIDPGVWASLKVSYNELSPKAKSCFLFCCLFAEDAQILIDDLMRYCVARNWLSHTLRTLEKERNVVRSVVDALKSASLLSNGSNENVVRIHDVIRDVGISIAREEQSFVVDHGALKWPRNLVNEPSAISLNSGKIRVLPDGLVYPQLHTLILDNNELSDLEVPNKFFSGMKQLTVLILIRIRMRRLPSSLAKLSNLRMLCLDECKLADIAILGDLKTNLEVLSLRGSKIEALPLEMAQLTSLRVLDLRDCHDLKLIPQGIISNLTNLEELYFANTFDYWEEIRLLLNTGQLTTLHIHIPDVTLLPKEDLMLENLKRFRISVGSYFEWDENFPGTRALKYEGSSLRKEFIHLVDKAEALSLVGIKGLKEVLDYRGVGKGFPELRYLKVESCDDDLEYFLGEPKSSLLSHRLHPLQSSNKLNRLVIEKCKLRYLFTPTAARELVHLEQLTVRSCEIMEAIVGFEGQNDENELIGDVMFSKLKGLSLQYLPNLKSFYSEKEKTQTTTGNASTHLQPLFSNKVILPVLEELEVKELDSIEEIWDKQPPLVNEKTASFSQLTDMTVKKCEKLMNLGPWNILSRLRNLQRLTVDGCPNVEFIVLFKNGKEEEEVANDSTLIIPLLRHLHIEKMEKLKSFYSSSTTANAQSLFNHQVVLPVLEELKVGDLDSIEEIWDKQSPSVNQEMVSFGQLRSIEVKGCEKLMNFIPSNILPRLQNLQDLRVEWCPNVEFVVFKNGNEEAANDSTLIIPRLTHLEIHNMEKLKSFYSSSTTSNAQSLFNHQVIFPVLEQLEIWGVDNIIEIWDKQSIALFDAQGSFCQLRNMEVRHCNKLTHLFPSKMHRLLKNLKYLYVRGCETLEGVVGFEGEEDEDGLRNEQVCFSKLTYLGLKELPKLVSFCTKMGEAGTTEGNPTIHAQPLFNGKVAFPALEYISIWNVAMITGIWVQQPLSKPEKEVESFCKLKSIKVQNCDQLEYVLPSYMLPQLHNRLQLDIRNCKELEVIVSNKLKEKEATNNDILVFRQLNTLKLHGLDNLKCFCTGTDQLLFSHKVAFPALERLSISYVPMITGIWVQQPLSKPEKEVEFFCKLKSITVGCCGQLEYVLPSYMLPQLHNLLELDIIGCKELEVIVSNKLKEKEATNNDILVFPQLETLRLRELDNLKCFCTGTDQLLFSHKVAFPTLEHLTITKVPQIKEIWDKQPLSEAEKEAISFCNLRRIYVQHCDQLVYVFPSSMLPQLQNLQKLAIANCKEMEVIISNKLKEKEATNNDIIPLAKLKTVILQNLPNLKRLCAEMQLAFSNKDAFPVLEIIIEEVAKKDHAGPSISLHYASTRSCIDPDLTFLVDGTSRKEIHSELKTREEKKNEMAVEHPMKIDSSFNNSSIQMNGSTDHVNSDFTLNRGSPSGSGSREAGNAGLRGLDNLGNTCFMNTAIQCLVHTSELVDHFKDYQKDIINTEESSGMKGELAFQFEDLLRKLRASEAGPVSPEEFKSKLVAIDPRFNDGNQHDSQEFLAFLLNELHEDLNCATCKPIEAIDVEGHPDEAESNKHWLNHLSCNTSIIVDLFHGQCQSKLVCPVCETKSSTFERFQDLSLPLPPTESESDTITLDQCLQTYLQEEILGQKDEWNCPNCKTDQPANKKLDLWRLPKILIIHLKRFSNTNKKLETFVDFPIDDFDLSGIVRNSQQSHHYILYAVINHYGVMGGGHYTASVQHEGDQWYKFDDSRVSPVAEHQIKSSAAYVLFYRRKEDV